MSFKGSERWILLQAILTISILYAKLAKPANSLIFWAQTQAWYSSPSLKKNSE